MSIITCCRCDRYIDLDFDSTPVCKADMPLLDVESESDMVCELCLTVRELDILNGED